MSGVGLSPRAGLLTAVSLTSGAGVSPRAGMSPRAGLSNVVSLTSGAGVSPNGVGGVPQLARRYDPSPL
jgi:hypothetical protein